MTAVPRAASVARRTLVALGALSVVALLPVAAPAGAAPAAPTKVDVTLTAPATASVGDVVPVEVWADGASSVAGYEVIGTVDPSAAAVDLVTADEDTVPGGARADISVMSGGDVGVLAAYSPTQTATGSGSTHLGTFMVRMNAAGTVDLRAASVQFVDARGNDLKAGGDKRVSIAVTDATLAGGRHWPAPPAPWAMAAQSAARPYTGTPAEVQLDFEAARLAESPCTGAVAAQVGGCVDIGDVQRLAATPEQMATVQGRAAGPENMTTMAVTADAATPPFVVNARGDVGDANIGDGICRTPYNTCTLRAAIEESNAIAGPNTINFAIPGNAPYVIQTKGRLPVIADLTGPVTINGYSQPGSAPNTDPVVDNARIMVQVAGGGFDKWDGFAITSPGNTIRGLSIHSFKRAIWIYRTGKGSAGNILKGDFIGTDPTGTVGAPSLVLAAHGVHIEQDSPNTVIGGSAAADRNVISGNGYNGVGIFHTWSDGTIVQGNIIGLSPDGTRPVPNRNHGLDLNFGASESLFGGFNPGEGNVLSANGQDGVELSHTNGTRNNRILGNRIGTLPDGETITSWSGNRNNGIWAEDGASWNTIRQNVFGGNALGAVRITSGPYNGASVGNIVRENWVGVSPGGRNIANGQSAMIIEGSQSKILDNVIAYAPGGGIVSERAASLQNQFRRNVIRDIGDIPIDLAPRGSVNPNDAGDGDTGPNTLLNFPVITSAQVGSIRGTACAGCVVEVFRTGTGGPGYGPAAAYIGNTTADSNGNWAFPAPSSLTSGSWISTTAIDPSGNTSEMSANARLD